MEKNGGDSRAHFHKNISWNKARKCNKRHSAANFEQQNHVVNGFVKLAPERIDGWMTRKFTSFSTVSQSYQKGNRVIMKDYVY